MSNCNNAVRRGCGGKRLAVWRELVRSVGGRNNVEMRRDDIRPTRIAMLAFALAAIAAYVPIVLFVFGIHTDFDQLYYKSYDFVFREAPQLFSVARPVAALFSNVTFLPISTLAGLRGYRCFSMISIAVIGMQLIWIATTHLRIRPFDALTVAICLLLVPGMYYAVMSAVAWVPHIGAIWFAVCCYGVLAKTNIRMITVYVYAQRRNWRGCLRSLGAYATSRPVVIAGILLQCGLFDYPTNALAVCLFPVALALCGRGPVFYRALLCFRDIVFIAVNLLLYFFAVKLLYFPLMKLVYPIQVFPTHGPRSEYHFGLTTNLHEVWVRLEEVLRVGGNLWFLPQYRFWIVTLAVVATACLVALLRLAAARRRSGTASLSESELGAALGFVVVATTYVFAAFPIIASSGGLASYRTVAIPTAISCVAFVFAIRSIAGALVRAGSFALPLRRSIPDFAAALVVCLAVVTTTYHVSITIVLARNEFAYAKDLVSRALKGGFSSLVVLDDRDTFFPEDVKEASDQHGRPIVPYELGCFSLNCFSEKPIYMEALFALGHTASDLDMEIIRGEFARRLSCADFVPGAVPDDVPLASARSYAAALAARGRVDCVVYKPIWRDLDFKRP